MMEELETEIEGILSNGVGIIKFSKKVCGQLRWQSFASIG
jgi:hypothetical protein